MTSVIRPVKLDDAASFAELRSAVRPYRVITAAGTRNAWQSMPESAKHLCLIAEIDGRAIGGGYAYLIHWTSEVGAAAMDVMVHRDHRRRGIGGRIYDTLDRHLRDSGASRLYCSANDEPETARWCSQRKFEPTRDVRFSHLDLTDVDALPPIPPLPPGVTVATFAEIGPEALYPLGAAASLDEPGDITADAVTYEAWLADTWQSPKNDYDASTVVLVDGVPAAYTQVEVDGAHRMWSGGTGTLPEHRGKGLAKIAKSIALRRAAQAGITAAFTGNDEANQPMLAINEWLGYQPCATEWDYVKVL
jgi:GNAT superfamily N-acetyltransferase